MKYLVFLFDCALQVSDKAVAAVLAVETYVEWHLRISWQIWHLKRTPCSVGSPIDLKIKAYEQLLAIHSQSKVAAI